MRCGSVTTFLWWFLWCWLVIVVAECVGFILTWELRRKTVWLLVGLDQCGRARLNGFASIKETVLKAKFHSHYKPVIHVVVLIWTVDVIVSVCFLCMLKRCCSPPHVFDTSHRFVPPFRCPCNRHRISVKHERVGLVPFLLHLDCTGLALSVFHMQGGLFVMWRQPKRL